MERWKDGRNPLTEQGAAPEKIHLSIEKLLDAWRRAGAPEAVIAEAIGRAARASAALVAASRKMGEQQRR